MTVGELQQLLNDIDPQTEVIVYDQGIKLDSQGYRTKGALIQATSALLFDVGYLGNGNYTFVVTAGEAERVLIIQ